MLQRMFLLMCLALLATAVGGCGSEEYEARLDRSKKLYEYMQELDQGLEVQPWIRGDLGISMRTPKPFKQPLAAPAPVLDEDGNPLPIINDPRQPDVLGRDLPGLVDAWTGQLGGGSDEAQALFFVCSNHQRYLDLGPQSEPPDEFLQDLEIAVQTGFGVLVPEGEAQSPADNVRYRLIAPTRSSPHAEYSSPKDFTAMRLVPTEPLGGRKIEGMLFEHTAGKIQLGILCIFPQEAGTQFRERLSLALETLVVSPEAPKPRSGSAGAPSSVRDPGF
ncbi:MAG: hypothetical protein R3C18_15835 [Planctomycetaceae bacterium]